MTDRDTDTTPTTPRQVFASLIGLAAGIFAWRWIWARLWDWQFRGQITQGADSIWNRDPFHGLALAGLTLMETFIAAMLAILVAYGVTLLVLAILRAVGRFFGRANALAHPEYTARRAQRREEARAVARTNAQIQVRAWSDRKP